MTVADDLARVEEALPGADLEAQRALKRVEAEIARLERDRDKAEKRAADSHEVMIRVYARAEAAEAEAARLREFVDHTLTEYGAQMSSQWKAHARALLAEDGAAQGCEYHRPLHVNGCRACEALAEDGAA